jgi:Protein of unknown function (DUF3172)
MGRIDAMLRALGIPILLSGCFGEVLAFQPNPTALSRRSSISPFAPNSGSAVHPSSASTSALRLARRRRYDSDDDVDDDYDDNPGDDYEDDETYVSRTQRRRRRRPTSSYPFADDLGGFDETSGLDLPSGFGRRDGWRLPESVSKALLAGVFVLGVGLGVTVDSQVNTNPRDLASRDAIDQAAPNPTLCAKLGASAMAFDQRVFVSFNPFNVYVSQADVKPACVLRDSNVVPVLKARGLINDDEVRACKNNMNTWAFVGSLEETPQLSCVYRSKDAQNEFLSNPKYGLGEDYLDDDRTTSTDKLIKAGLTDAQKQLKRTAAAAAAASAGA